jgi:putative ABC transport system permease protein
MNVVSQILAITATNLRNVPLRLGSSLVIVFGMAGVVGVLIPVIAMSLGFRSTIQVGARSDRAIVLSRIATDEEISSISRDDFARITNAAEIRHDSRDRPIASGEVVLQAPVSRKSDHSDVSLTLRGVGEQYFALRPELRLVAGRMYRPGNQEVVVGASALLLFEGLAIGDTMRLQDGDWTVVGTVGGDNGSRDSEVISDATTVMAAYKLDAFNSVTVALEDAASFDAFRDRVVRDTRRAAAAHTETEHAASLAASSSISRMLRTVAYAIGTIMGLGAFFSALNSMYSAVAARKGELATLRALGFSSVAVAFAVLLEALMLALLGASIGIGIAYLAFDGATMSTLGGTLSGTQLVFSLSITPILVLGATALACALGLAGGAVPAVRAARANIADALRET